MLVRPQREGDVEAIERIADLLSEDGISVVPFDRPAARAAASLRAHHGLKLPDAIIVATALEAGCDVIVGNDNRWHRIKDIAYVHLDDEVETR